MELTVKELTAMLEKENPNNKVRIASPDGFDLFKTINVKNINEHGITVIISADN